MNLNLKFTLYVCALSLATFVVLVVFTYYISSLQSQKKYREVVNAVANMGVEQLSFSLRAQGDVSTSKILSGLQSTEFILCAQVQSLRGVIQSEVQCIGKSDFEVSIHNDNLPKSYLGTLQIFENKNTLKAYRREYVLNESLTIFKVISVLTIIFLLAAYRLLTKPVEQLAQQLHAIDFYDDNTQPILQKIDSVEIQKIVSVINSWMVDARRRIKKERILSRQTERLTNNFKMIFHLSRNALAVIDNDLNLQSYNPRFKTLVEKNMSVDRLLGTNHWIACISHDPNPIAKTIQENTVNDTPLSIDIEQCESLHDGYSRQFFTLTYIRTEDEYNDVTILVFINDMTEHRQQLLQSQYNASHDNLTQLMNRRAAGEEIERILSESPPLNSLALLVIDLDGFKSINDNYGHKVGDAVLKIVAERIIASTRRIDIVSRWGGDEFVVVLTEMTLDLAKLISEKILKTILQPMQLHDIAHTESISASIGVMLNGDKNDDLTSLFYHADRAMYRAKQDGKCAVCVHQS